jgi:hypothetical protein
MCTGFEILPTIFGAAEVGAGIAAVEGAAGLGALSAGIGGGSALGGLGALGAGAVAGDMFLPGMLASEGLAAGAVAGDMFLPGALGAFGADAGITAGATFAGDMAAQGIFGTALDYGVLDGALTNGTNYAAASGLANPLATLQGFAKTAQPYMSAASGIKGLMDAEEMKRMARRAGRAADPWGNSGGRSLADAQLQELLRNPEAVAATDPAFKLRVMGAQRANAQYGQDSGAMSVAGANASTDWYNARLAQLSGLAGGGVAPGAGGGVMVQGLDNAFDASSAALGSLGYAAGTLGAGKGGMTPAQQQRLIQMAMGG